MFGGEDEDIAETQAFPQQSFALSLTLMVIVLMLQFDRLAGLRAMSPSCCRQVASFWACAANQPFGIVMCGLGVIALAGIVVNNNIVLIDTYNEYTRRGYRAREAAFRAGLVRFRPVVLTAVTTIPSCCRWCSS